jgi:DNA-binding response OmpR family regulator
MKTKILLVEDEADLGNVMKQYLEVMDFEVDWCCDGQAAAEKYTQSPSQYGLVLIDVNLPVKDGFELAHTILQTNINTPFLFLTARNEKADRLYGLKIGADDYITKPFDIDELVLRIRNIIRRRQPQQVSQNEIELGKIRLHRDSLKLVIGDEKEVQLTPREAELLEYLFKNANRVIKREEILMQLWGKNDYFLGRSLDVFISRLRKHLGNNEQISITNIYGVGFMFNVK